MRRGEVYEYAIGSQLARVVIVSANPYNPRLATFVVVRHPNSAPPPANIVVVTSPNDPVRGAIDASRLRPLDPNAVRARLGRLSPGTMAKVNRALQTYLDLAAT